MSPEEKKTEILRLMRKGTTQEGLARMTGIPRSTISIMLCGQYDKKINIMLAALKQERIDRQDLY